MFGNYVSQAGLEYQKQILYSICSDPIFDQVDCEIDIGKKHALKKYDKFALNTSCFWESTGSNITPVVQFYDIFVTKIMN